MLIYSRPITPFNIHRTKEFGGGIVQRIKLLTNELNECVRSGCSFPNKKQSIDDIKSLSECVPLH